MAVSVDVSDLRGFQQRAHELGHLYFTAWTGRIRRLGGSDRFELLVNGIKVISPHDGNSVLIADQHVAG